jgi:predicted phage terminase large subunit-like protein
MTTLSPGKQQTPAGESPALTRETLTREQLDAIIDAGMAEQARRTFADYCLYVHDFKLPEHLKVWSTHFDRPDSTRKAIVAPPESYKSTLIRYKIEWMIGHNPDLRVLWIMNAAKQAEKNVVSISLTMMTNPKYTKVFPDLKMDARKSQNVSTINVLRTTPEARSHPDPTLFGCGWEGAYQGMHPAILITDDLTDQADVKSDIIMESQRERLRGVILDRLEQGGDWWSIYTRWGEGDLHDEFDKMGFLILEQPVQGNYRWGNLLSPELFPNDRIVKLREDKGSALFTLTYMCDPGAATGSLIKRSWWKYYGELPDIPRGGRIHSWDMSTGKNELSDRSAFGHWGRNQYGFYLLDVFAEVLTAEKRMEKVKEFYDRDRPRVILIEEVSVSEDFIQTLTKKWPLLPVKRVPPGTKDKIARLNGIIGLIETGKVWLPHKGDAVEDFVNECARFGAGGRYDDQVDQMTQALNYLDNKIFVGISDGPVQIAREF